MDSQQKAAAWRAAWTMICVGGASGLYALLNEPTIIADFLNGSNSTAFWRFVFITFMAGVLNGAKKYLDIKLFTGSEK